MFRLRWGCFDSVASVRRNSETNGLWIGVRFIYTDSVIMNGCSELIDGLKTNQMRPDATPTDWGVSVSNRFRLWFAWAESIDIGTFALKVSEVRCTIHYRWHQAIAPSIIFPHRCTIVANQSMRWKLDDLINAKKHIAHRNKRFALMHCCRINHNRLHTAPLKCKNKQSFEVQHTNTRKTEWGKERKRDKQRGGGEKIVAKVMQRLVSNRANHLHRNNCSI